MGTNCISRGRSPKPTMSIEFLRWTVVVAGVLAIPICNAQSPKTAAYPQKALHLIVPFPAGGGADYWGHLVATKLGEELGQQVIVDNIPGRGGNNGTAAAAVAAADGYTLLLGSIGPLAVHPFTYTRLPFDPEKNFSPIALLESSPILLVANPGVKASSVNQLIAFAKEQPGQLTYASNGDGSPEEVAGELFKRRTHTEIRHIPFDGAGPARKAVLSGGAALMFDPCKGAFPAIRQGTQTALAVAAPERLAGLPYVPTFREAGIADYDLRIWTGVLAPAGTPAAIVSKLNRAIEEILKTPEIRREIADEGGVTAATTPTAFGSFLRTERARWHELVRESGVPLVP